MYIENYTIINKSHGYNNAHKKLLNSINMIFRMQNNLKFKLRKIEFQNLQLFMLETINY